MNFLSVQIYKTLKAYPLYDVPKILREESQKSDLTLFKLKLHDFTFNLKQISQHEFEKISGGRLQKLDDESIFEIAQNLYDAVKVALALMKS